MAVMGDFVTQTSKRSSEPSKTSRVQRQQTQPRVQRQQTKSAPSPAPSVPGSSGPVESVTQPSPKPKSISDWLAGDEAFQQAKRGGQRSLQDLLSDITRRRGEAETSFGQTRDVMETDRERQLDRMKEEFASRGLIHSGIYGQEQGRFQEDFQSQIDQLMQAQEMLLADLTSQQTNYKRQNELAMEAARQEALNRRAARFNLT